MYLSDNQLTGSIDPGWQLPEALSDFRTANNSLTGLLPAWNLPNLKKAVFLDCNFTGKHQPERGHRKQLYLCIAYYLSTLPVRLMAESLVSRISHNYGYLEFKEGWALQWFLQVIHESAIWGHQLILV